VIVDELQHGRTLLQAYALFSVLCGAIGLPAIMLCLFLARPGPARVLDLAPIPTTNEGA
jgi:hypothetical protein